MPEPESVVKKLSFDRIVFFSDAIVAIAITLLVLPLVDSVPDEGKFKASELLSDDGALLLAFAISFFVIARFWLIHHRIFTKIDGYTSKLVWANMAFLISIVWLPFPTEMVGVQADSDAGARGIYIGSLLVTSLCIAAIEYVVLRTPGLWVDPDDSGVDLTNALAAAGALVAALVIALTVPAIGMWALLLLFASPQVVKVVDRRRSVAHGH
jgi:uncharacterized membrane protein